MKTPRQLYTQEETKQIEDAAQRSFENLAADGIYLPFLTCLELAEFAFIEKSVKVVNLKVCELLGVPA